ncbi:MAG TPA: endopeptidase La [candidate division WOR-3 bacterium]|uniref:Lon protease n=1 Tax=candidate division WOR-3 bacterium TaxID=2052148 RepID=A0A7C0V9G7_UNCW3|nr:endopeptidase La [candidate division WOR-3 bacterium]
MELSLEKEEIRIPSRIPVLPLRDAVAFPHILNPMAITLPRNIKLVDDALNSDKIIGLVLQKGEEEFPSPENLYRVGTAGVIFRMFRLPDGSLRILVKGLERFRIKEFVSNDPYYVAEIEILKEIVKKDMELEALAKDIVRVYQELVNLSPYLPEELSAVVMNIEDPARLADFIATNTKMETEQRQEILETLDVKERLKKILAILTKELDVLKLGEELRNKIKNEMEKAQREYLLREQLKAIKKELGEEDEREAEFKELSERIEKAGMPDEVKKVALKELDRMKMMPPQAAEYTVIRTYLDWLIELPWSKETEDNLDIKRAKRILDADHYDLQDVKERILEFLAVRKLKKDSKGPILCFVGPPGVGKTSLGRSIARALGRKFIRMSLGGVKDEAEIRGHRRTYVGALPGRIIQSIRRAGSKNPVFMLDEVDKIGMDFRGDPASALLEVLDPEQNNTFMDHYLDVPFDLSRVMFITTANVTHTIPPALLDRMEVISIPGYTVDDKLKIARKYLLPRQIKENGLSRKDLEITDDAIVHIITRYTREAGVRNLEREIGKIARKVAKRITMGDKGPFSVDVDDIEKYLGPIRYPKEKRLEKPRIGVATGLAWTPFGGDILFVEATKMKGKRNLILTGQLGDVMQESAQAGLSYIRSNAKKFGIDPDFFDKYDIHIHIPEGAIPKDGPSAGITMCVAVVSVLSEKPVRTDIAMTGEITLRGEVLPVGGIKEKVLAAKMAGINHVILPEENRKDVKMISARQRKGMKFHYVENVDQALKLAMKVK